LRIPRQRKTEVRIERAFVKFVEQHGRNARQFRIVQNLAGKIPSVTTSMRVARETFEPKRTIADGLADLLAQRLSHPLGSGAPRSGAAPAR
jgi:hypothetical protein